MGHRGFTLIELVVSVAVTGVLAAGIASAVLVAGKAMPDAGGRATATADAARLVQRIADDVELATDIVALGPDKVTFKVADRNGDGVEETYSYALDLSSGRKLTRTTNGGTPVVVAENIAEFALTATTESVDVASTTSQITEAERLLYVFKGATTGGVSLKLLSNEAMWINPVLPSDAVSYIPTKVRLFLAPSGAKAGITTVALKGDGNGKPSMLGFDQGTILEASLANGGTWTTVTFSNGQAILAGTAFFVVVSTVDATTAADLAYAANPVAQSLACRYSSADGGSTWTPYPESAFPIEVYGRVVRSSTPKVTSSGLSALDIRLRIGKGEAALGAARPVGKPVVRSAAPPAVEIGPPSMG